MGAGRWVGITSGMGCASMPLKHTGKMGEIDGLFVRCFTKGLPPG